MLSIGLLVLRVVVGLTLMGHGAQKLFGWFQGPGLSGFGGMLEQLGVRPSRTWALVSALAEGIGGLLVAVGLFTPIAALAVAANLLVAAATVHLSRGFWNQNGGFEYPLTLAATMVGLSLIGPGAISLDQLLRVSLPEPQAWIITAIVAAVGVLAASLSPRVGARASGSQRTREGEAR